MTTIVFATGNKGKLREAKEIFNNYDVKSIFDFTDDFDPEEYGKTFIQNAIIKAEAALKVVSNYPVLSDDSGLVVTSLDGAPGIYSSRYAGPEANDQDNRKKMLSELNGVDMRRAWFSCTAVLLFPDYSIVSTQGRCNGVIGSTEKGSGGFGYDPIFIPDGFEKSMAELNADEKNEISHRGVAFRKLGRLVSCIQDWKE